MKEARRAIAWLAISVGLIEGGLALLLSHPHWAGEPGFLLDGLRSIYVREDWSVPQVDPGIVSYDPQLTYLLRPGTARFRNREFDTTLHANRAGLRDDEASLERPDIIVLGDSYAMGWGVEQTESFPQVLERKTGLKVLNAAMSSFGTAREIMLLERLDTIAARAVVIQYFLNDFEENRAFLDRGFTLETAPRDVFEQRTRDFRRQTRYRPLDYLAAFVDRSSYFPELEAASPDTVADACLEILASAEALEGLPVVFLQIDPWGDSTYNVVDELQRLLATAEYEDLRQRMRFVRLGPVLSRQDFFILDPHLRPSGHEKVATAVAAALAAGGDRF